MEDVHPNYRVFLSSLWGVGGLIAFLGPIFGATDYLLETTLPPELSEKNKSAYITNESVWRDLIGRNLIPGIPVVLQSFQIMNWFPRAPGPYYSLETSCSGRG